MPEIALPPEVTQTQAPQTPTEPARPAQENSLRTWARRFGLAPDGQSPASQTATSIQPEAALRSVAEGSAPQQEPLTEASVPDTQPVAAETPRVAETITVNGHEYPKGIEYRMSNSERTRNNPSTIDSRRTNLSLLTHRVQQRAAYEGAGWQKEPTEWDKQDEQDVAYCLDAGLLKKTDDGKLEIVADETPSTVGVARKEYFPPPNPEDVYKGPDATRYLNTTVSGWIELKARTGNQGDPSDAQAAAMEGRRQGGRLAAHVVTEDSRDKSWSTERVAFDPDTRNIKDAQGNVLPYGSPDHPIFEVGQDTVAIYTGKEEPVTYSVEQLQKEVIGIPLSNYMELLVTRPNGETGALVIGTKRNIPLPDVFSPSPRVNAVASESGKAEDIASDHDRVVPVSAPARSEVPAETVGSVSGQQTIEATPTTGEVPYRSVQGPSEGERVSGGSAGSSRESLSAPLRMPDSLWRSSSTTRVESPSSGRSEPSNTGGESSTSGPSLSSTRAESVSSGASERTASGSTEVARVDALPPVEPPLPQRVDTIKKSPGWKKWLQKAKRTLLIPFLVTAVGGAASMPDTNEHFSSTSATSITQTVGERPSLPWGAPASMPEIGRGKITPAQAEDVAKGLETKPKMYHRELMGGNSLRGDILYQLIEAKHPEVVAALAQTHGTERLSDRNAVVQQYKEEVERDPLYQEAMNQLLSAVVDRDDITGDDKDTLRSFKSGYDMKETPQQVLARLQEKQQKEAGVS